MKRRSENIRWGLHERHLQSVFAMHFLQDRFCDVTLACKDGQRIRAHRTILCACSGYFDTVWTGDASGKETLVIMKDCDYQDMKLIIQFMYYGEINVDENRLPSLLRTAGGLQINGLTEAFHNFNKQDRDSFVVRKTESSLPDNRRAYRIDAANASPLIIPVGSDKKEPDWSDYEDDNDCVRVYLVSEDEENCNSDEKDIADAAANGPGFTQPKSFLPFQDINMVFDAASTDRAMSPSDVQMGQMELEDGEDFKGWYLTAVDNKVPKDERVDPFSTAKKIALKNILSRSTNRPRQTLVPSQTSKNGNIENRNGTRFVEMNQSTPRTFSTLQPKPSFKPSSSAKQSMKIASCRSSTGTSKMDLLSRLQRSLQHKFDGRIRELNIDDLQNYSVENEKGTCQVKCSICDKFIKVRYGKYESRARHSSSWILNDVGTHINRHFK